MSDESEDKVLSLDEWHLIYSLAEKEEERVSILRMMSDSKNFGCSNSSNSFFDQGTLVKEKFMKTEDFEKLFRHVQSKNNVQKVTQFDLEQLFNVENKTVVEKRASQTNSQGLSVNGGGLEAKNSGGSIDIDFGEIDEIFSEPQGNDLPYEMRKGYSSSYENSQPKEHQPQIHNAKINGPSTSCVSGNNPIVKDRFLALERNRKRGNENESTSKGYPRHEDNQSNNMNKPKCDFKSARQELQIQNIIKYGKDTRSNLPSSGVRRTGLSKSAVPKYRPSDHIVNKIDTKENSSQEEEIPEQLKAIDPEIVEMVKREIMMKIPKLNWEDIIGLSFAKKIIQEAIVLPMLRPDIFTGLRRPPRGILLFGPPGTGKTLIGKCIASRANATFFNISASALTSKWIGQGEKMVRGLFACASVQQPSVIFIDEVDSLLCQRSDSEHESSRRLKTEFMIHLDGAATNDNELILLVGATNRPQELDEAVRRRFVKRLYIPLPIQEARLDMIKSLLSTVDHNLTQEQMVSVSQLTEGFSGADMKSLSQDASMGPVRSIPVDRFESFLKEDLQPVCYDDFKAALQTVRASVSPKDIDGYLEWDKIYGSGGAMTAGN